MTYGYRVMRKNIVEFSYHLWENSLKYCWVLEVMGKVNHLIGKNNDETSPRDETVSD